MQLKVLVATSDKYLWAMQAFANLFNTYWSAQQPVTVVGYTPPEFQLPDNFTFYSIRSPEYPQGQWSDGIIEYLANEPEDMFTLMLDDYWLCRTVDVAGVATLGDYLAEHPTVLRLDLTTDRLYAGGMFEVESFGHYDIIETPEGTPYQMSLQAGIWRKALLLSLLERGKSPWEVELHTSPPASMRVLGTRQWPCRYINVFKGGDPGQTLNVEQLTAEHRDYLGRQGWLASPHTT